MAGGGYCICGADDQLLTVYLYRPIGEYAPGNPGYQFILHSIATRLARIEAAKVADPNALQPYQGMLKQRAAQWQELSNRRVPTPTYVTLAPSLTPTLLTLPVTTSWSQGSPYNLTCPTLPPAGGTWRCVTGCVATATAQLQID